MFGTELLLGPLAATSIIGLCTILLVYWLSVRNHDYWKKRGVPSAKAYPFVGSLLEVCRKPLQDVELERYNELGRLYGHFEGNSALLSVADPELLRHIFVKDFHIFSYRRPFKSGVKVVDSMLSALQGEDWKRVRTIVSPTFSTGKIKRMLGIFKDCARTLVQNFKDSANEGKPIEAKRVFGAFTMDIIASSNFSTKIDSHNDPENKFVQMARKVVTRNISWRLVAFFIAPKLVRFLHISVFPSEPIEFFKDVTLQIIQERKRNRQVRNDFLQLLMDTAEELNQEEKLDTAEKEKGDITSNYGEEDTGHQIFKTVTSKNLSMNEVVAQCIIFFVAGYDTTASTLSFATYLLALNPEIQDKLREEVDGALKESTGELTYEAVKSMKYLDNVISETLRLFPPALKAERTADADYKLGDTGLTVPKGMIISIPVYAMHRDPEYFPDPEKFDPDRFNAEERAKRDQYVYLPFGAGPRNCVAMRFALMEIKVCLAYVISTFVIKRCPQTKVPLDFYMSQGLLQPKEVFLTVEPRTDCPLIK